MPKLIVHNGIASADVLYLEGHVGVFLEQRRARKATGRLGWLMKAQKRQGKTGQEPDGKFHFRI
jgi:hypothetical protein